MKALLVRVLLGLVLVIGMSSEPGCAMKARAVSLKVLQGSLKSSSMQASLCGITHIRGYMADRTGRDLILIGEVNPREPALSLDDFVVALRAAKLVYGHREGRTIYYTAPGCSIDPNPNTIRQLQQLRGQQNSSDWIDGWNAIGSQPQKVRVMGIPFDTRFAKVMVDADYYMKRLVNGSVDLKIDGFTSLMGMRAADVKRQLETGTRTGDGGMSLSRFWFCPGECSYTDNNGMVLLERCQVKLLTEDEFLANNGQIAGTGRSGALAKRFADGFTTKYNQIASARPIYRDLEQLFRLAALAKILQDQKADTKSGVSLGYLVNRYRVDTVPVSRQVTGLTRTQAISYQQQTDEGTLTTSTTLMSCGGVSMDFHPKRIVTRTRTHQPKMKSRSTTPNPILAARKSKTALYWDVELPK